MEDLAELLAVARGDEPAHLLLSNAKIVNVYSGEIEEGSIAIWRDRVAGIGSAYRADETFDLKGAFVAPGLIDAHVHIESSLCLPGEFARAVVPRGITTAVTDPHEIANVAGAAGVQFMANAAQGLPLRVIIMAPSCVPATELATSGATLDAGSMHMLVSQGIVHGLAEVMNFPGVIGADDEVLQKLEPFEDRPRDGHAPGVLNAALNAYAAAGIGSDHESTTIDEAREKLARGLYVFIREATNAHNLHTLLPMITPANSRRICFCTDDRQPHDLLTQGGIDYMLREAIRGGIHPVEAFRLCTLNPCEWFRLHDRGAIAPGKLADLIVFDDLRAPHARQIFSGGKLLASDGEMLVQTGVRSLPLLSGGRGRIDWSHIHFPIIARSARMRVIGALPNQLITDHRIEDVKVDESNLAVANLERDILKMAVIERHRGTGNAGFAFVHGFGLKHGAIAGTVAHDHHNLIVIGCDDLSMLTAARAISEGGLAIADGERVIATLPLPIAGLMSDQPIEQVRTAYEALLAAAKSAGSALHDPFMAMSFMALEVIPRLKLTDQGLVDVEHFRFVDLFV